MSLSELSVYRSDRSALSSVSGDPEHRPDVVKMAHWLNDHLKAVGVTTSLIALGRETGTDLQLPPAIVGRIGTDPTKKTVLLYGHFDVQPVGRATTLVLSG